MSVLANNYQLLVLSTLVLVLYDPCFLKHQPWSSMASPQSVLEIHILSPHTRPTASQSGFSQDPHARPFLPSHVRSRLRHVADQAFLPWLHIRIIYQKSYQNL